MSIETIRKEKQEWKQRSLEGVTANMLGMMTHRQYLTGQPFVGFFYSPSLKCYLNVDQKNQFVSANSPFINDALLFTIQRNFNDDAIIRTNIAGTEYYLSWTNDRAYAILYSTYFSFKMQNWTPDGQRFRIFCTRVGGEMGTKPNTGNLNQLFYAPSLENNLFEFHAIQFRAF